MFVTSKKAEVSLGVTAQTLRNWERTGKIKTVRTAGGQRRYDVVGFLASADEHQPARVGHITHTPLHAIVHAQPSGFEAKTRSKIIYCRVSSPKQKDDLGRQVNSLRTSHPYHEVIQDVGSGLNFKRRGLRRLLDRCARGDVEEVVVAHRDRLCRFGIDWLLWFFDLHGVRLIFQDDHVHSPQQELVEDLMAVVHVFSCRLNGQRRYRKRAIVRADDDNVCDMNASDSAVQMAVDTTAVDVVSGKRRKRSSSSICDAVGSAKRLRNHE